MGFEEEAKYLLALKLYELGRISYGKAAKIAELRRVELRICECIKGLTHLLWSCLNFRKNPPLERVFVYPVK